MMSSPTSFCRNTQPNSFSPSAKFSRPRSSLYCDSTAKAPPSSRPRFRPSLRLELPPDGLKFPRVRSERSASSPSLRLKFIEFVAKKAAAILLGSFIFAGFATSGQSLVLSAKAVETQKEKEAVVVEEEGKGSDGMWEKVLEGDPRNVEALKVLLYGKMREGKMKEAVKYVERLIDVEGKDVVEWRLLLGLCYETMGQLSTAKRIFREILGERPLLLRALHV